MVVAAAGALARIGDGAAFEPLLTLLAHRDAAVRQAAIGALNSIGHPLTCRRAIAELLTSDDHFVRESAVRIAGYFGYPETGGRAARAGRATRTKRFAGRRSSTCRSSTIQRVPAVLIAALHEDTPPARAAAARALSRIEDGAGAAALRRRADRPGRLGAVLRRALAGVPARCRQRGRMLLRLAASDPRRHVRIAAIEAVGAIGGADVLPQSGARGATLPIATSPPPRSRRSGGWPTPPVAAAGRGAEERRPARRIAALRALIAHGSSGAVAALEWTAAADAEPAVVRLAMDGLQTGAQRRTAPAAMRRSMRWSDCSRMPTAGRLAVAHCSATLPAPASPGLASDWPLAPRCVRRATVDALVPDPRSAKPPAVIVTALDDEAAEVREAAVGALMRDRRDGRGRRLEALSLRDPSSRGAPARRRLRTAPADRRGAG